MIDVNERIDLDLTLLEDENEDVPCTNVQCPRAAEWTVIVECGHSFNYCTVHKEYLDHSPGKVKCLEHEPPIFTKIIRWEKM